MEEISKAEELFKECLEWLGSKYRDYNSFLFFHERDIAWTIQKYIIKIITDTDKFTSYRVFNDCQICHPQLGKPRPDLIILHTNQIQNDKLMVPLDFVAEIKFAPSKDRKNVHFLGTVYPQQTLLKSKKILIKLMIM